MTALLKAWGNKPELRDELISAVSEGRRQSSISSRSGVGMESREQVLGAYSQENKPGPKRAQQLPASIQAIVRF